MDGYSKKKINTYFLLLFSLTNKIHSRARYMILYSSEKRTMCVCVICYILYLPFLNAYVYYHFPFHSIACKYIYTNERSTNQPTDRLSVRPTNGSTSRETYYWLYQCKIKITVSSHHQYSRHKINLNTQKKRRNEKRLWKTRVIYLDSFNLIPRTNKKSFEEAEEKMKLKEKLFLRHFSPLFVKRDEKKQQQQITLMNIKYGYYGAF